MSVRRVPADPDWANQRIALEKQLGIRTPDEKYGYSRAYYRHPESLLATDLVVLDPTSGGGSIPFEALRLGAKVIANELNPVATVILKATLDYPARFGPDLADDIAMWGGRLRLSMVDQVKDLFPPSKLENPHPELDDHETLDGFLYTRTVTCPHCSGNAPLLNTCWLSKETKGQWGVRVVALPDKTVRFETYRCVKGKGPNGEDPEPGTVNRGTGQCIHCKQAIDGDEVKAQARGDSPLGKWWDTLYTVVAVRNEPVLDTKGRPIRYKSGDRKGEIKTRKVRFFRPPNERDHTALKAAEQRLKERWDEWEAKGLIPTEKMPDGYRRNMRDCIHSYGINHWRDMFIDGRANLFL